MKKQAFVCGRQNRSAFGRNTTWKGSVPSGGSPSNPVQKDKTSFMVTSEPTETIILINQLHVEGYGHCTPERACNDHAVSISCSIDIMQYRYQVDAECA